MVNTQIDIILKLITIECKELSKAWEGGNIMRTGAIANRIAGLCASYVMLREGQETEEG